MSNILINSYIKANFNDIDAYIFTSKVKDILPIYYVAVRGKDIEEGAVQRALNKRRISSISEFVLKGNSFFNTFILNWTNENHKVKINNNSITIPIVNNAAQVIDGQHRLLGLKEAFDKDETVGEKEILIVLTLNLKTKQAANIFLNINSEQKPVPSSLVFDLFGEISDGTTAIDRAADIANALNDEKDSPYYNCIKMPSGKGKIDLSTVINSLKKYIDKDGVFNFNNLEVFEIQKKVIFNFLDAIKYYYENDRSWLLSKNPFMTNAGFYALMRFLSEDLIPICVQKGSFEVDVIKKLLPLDEIGLIYKEDIKNIQGKEQREIIYKHLKTTLSMGIPKSDEYKF